MPSRRRFNPHRVIHAIKFWAIEIAVLLVFLKWLGGSLWHELGSHAETLGSTCESVDMRDRERK